MNPLNAPLTPLNTICVAKRRSKYIADPHLTILIDNEPLDLFISVRLPDSATEGLVPAWLNWMYDSREQEVVYERMRPIEGVSARVPILMCPDDLDFSCSLIIAEVMPVGDLVRWLRLGIDKTMTIDPKEVGKEVSWFEELHPMAFDRTDYEACVREFEKLHDA